MYYKDLLLMQELIKYGEKIIHPKFNIYIEKDYLSDVEQNSIIYDVERYIMLFEQKDFRNIKINEKIKPTLFFHRFKIPSHIYGGYNNKGAAYILLSHYKFNKSPILHELTHVVLPKSDILFLREGIAIYMEKRYGNSTCFPFDIEAINVKLEYKDIVEQFQTNEYDDKRTFYIMSYYFCVWIINKYTFEKLLKLYNNGLSDFYSIFNSYFLDELKEWYKFFSNQ